MDAAYRLMASFCSGHLGSFYQCLPCGWFIWWDTFEDDQQQRTVMIHDNQQEGFDDMLAAIDDLEHIPEDVSEDFARGLIRTHFADIPDPLPHWTDIKALLDAKRKGCEIHRYTFEDKRRFDPKVLAEKIVREQHAAASDAAFPAGYLGSNPCVRALCTAIISTGFWRMSLAR